HTFRAPANLAVSDSVHVAVRPEDLRISAPSAFDHEVSQHQGNWQGKVDQSIDLGHYRKLLVIVPGLFSDQATALGQRIKVYVPKALDIKEGENVTLYPSRYLVYAGQADPIEVRNQPDGNSNENRRDDLARTPFAVAQKSS